MTASTTSQVQLRDPLLSHPLAGGLRASDADRERTVDVLSDAFAEGRLSTEELSARVDQVYRARTYAELAAVSADLPSVPAASPPVPRSGGGTAQRARAAGRRTSPLAVAALVCSVIPGLPQLAAIILGIEALRRIRRTGERGAVFATAGLALAALGLTLALFLVS
jgi:Domain of unknown function (DUF1707)/Domain of unknown function (DUF4190)